MLPNEFDFNTRNMKLIQTLMEIVGVVDCEELPEKVISLKHAAQQMSTNGGIPVTNDIQPIKGTGGKGYRRRH